MYAPELPLSPEAQAEIEALKVRRDALADQLEEHDEADESAVQKIYGQIDEIDRCILSIRRNRRLGYSDEIKSSCGVVIAVGQDGQP